VPDDRVDMTWLPPGEQRRLEKALHAFRAHLRGLSHD
jgi:hypothetical protein